MAAGEWSGFENGDLEMDFAGAKFIVHRAIAAHASPVWKAMLTGAFAESAGSTIRFDGDDPQVARLCIEMIYSMFSDSTLDWVHIESRVTSDRAAFDAFVDKYDLRGVKRLVEYELCTRQETRQREDAHQQSIKRLEGEVKKLQPEVDRLERKVAEMATSPGMPVNIEYHKPEPGTRVKRMIPDEFDGAFMNRKQWFKYHAVATIIAIDGEFITVRWKKGGGVRSYNPIEYCLEYA